jgi:hypothetical protein
VKSDPLVCWECGVPLVIKADGAEKPCGHVGALVMPMAQWKSIRGYRMPLCATCGHPWAVHIIPGGVANLDVYPHERHCVDCACRNYVEPAVRAVAPPQEPI